MPAPGLLLRTLGRAEAGAGGPAPTSPPRQDRSLRAGKHGPGVAATSLCGSAASGSPLSLASRVLWLCGALLASCLPSRLVLWGLGIWGCWAAAAPGAFSDSFPGPGRSVHLGLWVRSVPPTPALGPGRAPGTFSWPSHFSLPSSSRDCGGNSGVEGTLLDPSWTAGWRGEAGSLGLLIGGVSCRKAGCPQGPWLGCLVEPVPSPSPHGPPGTCTPCDRPPSSCLARRDCTCSSSAPCQGSGSPQGARSSQLGSYGCGFGQGRSTLGLSLLGTPAAAPQGQAWGLSA